VASQENFSVSTRCISISISAYKLAVESMVIERRTSKSLAALIFPVQAVQSTHGGLCSDTQELSMSKKEPKIAKNMSAQQAVENLFHPKASGNAKTHAEGAKKPRKKGS